MSILVDVKDVRSRFVIPNDFSQPAEFMRVLREEFDRYDFFTYQTRLVLLLLAFDGVMITPGSVSFKFSENQVDRILELFTGEFFRAMSHDGRMKLLLDLSDPGKYVDQLAYEARHISNIHRTVTGLDTSMNVLRILYDGNEAVGRQRRYADTLLGHDFEAALGNLMPIDREKAEGVVNYSKRSVGRFTSESVLSQLLVVQKSVRRAFLKLYANIDYGNVYTYPHIEAYIGGIVESRSETRFNNIYHSPHFLRAYIFGGDANLYSKFARLNAAKLIYIVRSDEARNFAIEYHKALDLIYSDAAGRALKESLQTKEVMRVFSMARKWYHSNEYVGGGVRRSDGSEIIDINEIVRKNIGGGLLEWSDILDFKGAAPLALRAMMRLVDRIAFNKRVALAALIRRTCDG